MNTTMEKQRSALAFSIPPSMVIGLVKANTSRQLAIMTISASQESFLNIVDGFVLATSAEALADDGHEADADTNRCDTV